MGSITPDLMERARLWFPDFDDEMLREVLDSLTDRPDLLDAIEGCVF
jgi:hypothetical protein